MPAGSGTSQAALTVRFNRKSSLIVIVVAAVMLLVAAIDFTYFARNGGSPWAAVVWAIVGAITLAVGVRRLTSKFARVTPTSVEIKNAVVGSRTYPIEGLTDLDFVDDTLYRRDGTKLATFKQRQIDLEDFIRLGSAILHAHAGAITASRQGRRPQP